MELDAFCPYCGERISFAVDEGGGADQRYVEDCEVCCRPIEVRVRTEAEDGPYVLDVRGADE